MQQVDVFSLRVYVGKRGYEWWAASHRILCLEIKACILFEISLHLHASAALWRENVLRVSCYKCCCLKHSFQRHLLVC